MANTPVSDLRKWYDNHKNDEKMKDRDCINLKNEEDLRTLVNLVVASLSFGTFWSEEEALQQMVMQVVAVHLEIHYRNPDEDLVAKMVQIPIFVQAHETKKITSAANQQPFVPDPNIEEPIDPRDGKLFAS